MEASLAVCMSCGCGQPMDCHGDWRNIDYSCLQAAAKACSCTVRQVIQNMSQTLDMAHTQELANMLNSGGANA